jgi:serine/threonine-protein kinase
MLIIPAREAIPTSSADHVRTSADDVAVYRPYARMSAKILASREAALLHCFRQPRTIAEALIEYCSRHGGDPRELLAESYEFLDMLAQDGVIVRAESTEAARLEPSLPIGENVQGFVISRCVAFASDTEVYEARAADGGKRALKLTRCDATPAIASMLDREIAVLTRLNGRHTPLLMARGTHRDHQFIATSWIDGESAEVTGASYFGAVSRAHRARRALSILNTYAGLHESGVVHGDVHTRNVIVTPSGSAVVIDFGLARILDDDCWSAAPRGGVAQYSEPEYAEALLQRRVAGPATAAGEQYALAAMIYRLLTGADYLAFPAHHELLYTHIVNAPPRSFADSGAVAWPSIEDVLRQALSKRPADRFQSVREFADAFARAGKKHARPARLPSSGIPRFIANVSQQLLSDGEGSLLASASLRTGAAGTAYAIYRLACAADDAGLLAAADVWATKALQSIPPGPRLDTAGSVSSEATPQAVLCSGLGAQVVNAHVQTAMANPAAVAASIAAYASLAATPPLSMDVTFGRAGVLLYHSLLLSLPELGDEQIVSLVKLGSDSARFIEREAANMGRVGDEALANLGIAHGWAGLIYSSLMWHLTTNVPVREWIRERLHELAGCGTRTDHGIRWSWQDTPPHRGAPIAFMPGWCNGSAGFVHLWILATRMLKDPAFDELAAQSAWDVWEQETRAWDLCCGAAGRAYALLAYYRHSGERRWLERAHRLAMRAVRDAECPPAGVGGGPVGNLMRGSAGVAVLAAELGTVEDARMPLFELERWPGSPAGATTCRT